jgi:hypothetical protein
MKVEDIHAKMEKLNVFIQDAEITVRGGTMADLSGLDKEVAVICTKAVSLPPDDARSVQPLMATLIRNLERLSIALVEYKEDLKK